MFHPNIFKITITFENIYFFQRILFRFNCCTRENFVSCTNLTLSTRKRVVGTVEKCFSSTNALFTPKPWTKQYYNIVAITFTLTLASHLKRAKTNSSSTTLSEASKKLSAQPIFIPYNFGPIAYETWWWAHWKVRNSHTFFYHFLIVNFAHSSGRAARKKMRPNRDSGISGDISCSAAPQYVVMRNSMGQSMNSTSSGSSSGGGSSNAWTSGISNMSSASCE